MENYIYELFKKKGIIELEKEIEVTYPLVKATVMMQPSQRQLRIVLTDRVFHFIAAYEASDFDCKPIEQCYLPYGLDKLPKSEKSCDDETIRKLYLRFMNREFDTFYEDYKNHQLKLVDKDLDCEASV